jgi:hypothetical protein
MKKSKPFFHGPIPGENYLADTKNYPWHKPPDIVDYDEGVEYMMQKLGEKPAVAAIAALTKKETSILELTKYNVLGELKAGTFSIDLGLLLAGPIAKTIEMIAKSQNVDPYLGWEQEPTLLTSDMLDRTEGIDPKKLSEDTQNTVDSVEEEPKEGLMAEPTIQDGEEAPIEEQDEMLGDTKEEVELEPTLEEDENGEDTLQTIQ